MTNNNYKTTTIFVVYFLLHLSSASEHSKNLYSDIFKSGKYNKLIRPVGGNTDKLVVSVGLRLISIIDVDEKNQIMTTNVWLEQTWTDYKLQWEPEKYGNVKKLYVPPEVIWLPDIILYNSADGNFTINVMTKATIHHTGLVSWSPPAVYKSLCLIDVEFFPFDQQICILKIGSWSYDGNLVDIKHNQLPDGEDDLQTVEQGINLTDYGPSTEWDLLAVPSKKFLKYYPCCSEPFPDLKFHITIRRKTLYHTVNLILPCVAICALTVFVFLVPALSGEKITMAITILNSLNIFLLLVAEINPPTSLATPLIGKYLLFTMVLVTCSIIVTVFVLNVHFRSPSTHEMSPFVRKLFLEVLPRLLFMQRPDDKRKELQKKLKINGSTAIMMSTRNRPETGANYRPDDVASLIKRDTIKMGQKNKISSKNTGKNSKKIVQDCKSFDSLGRHYVKVFTVNNPKYNYYSGKGGKNNKTKDPNNDDDDDDYDTKDTNIDDTKYRKYSGKVRFETGNSMETENTSADELRPDVDVLKPEKSGGLKPEVHNESGRKKIAESLSEKRKRLRKKQEYDNDVYDSDDDDDDYDNNNNNNNNSSDDDDDDSINEDSDITEIWFHNKNNTNNNNNTNTNTNNSTNNKNNNRNRNRNKASNMPAPLMQAVYGVNFIAEHIRQQEASEKIKEDWKFISVIMDRLFMWVFAGFCVVGTCSIILQAPMLYDTRVPIG